MDVCVVVAEGSVVINTLAPVKFLKVDVFLSSFQFTRSCECFGGVGSESSITRLSWLQRSEAQTQLPEGQLARVGRSGRCSVMWWSGWCLGLKPLRYKAVLLLY